MILNLTDKDNSSVMYETRQYPDGQQDIVIKSSYTQLLNEKVWIHSRMNSWKDIELIIAATKALRRLDVEWISLYSPYILGARSDRQFEQGGTSYLVDVIAPVINSLNFHFVQALDVHSDVTAAAIQRFKSKSNFTLVQDFRRQFGLYLTDMVLVSPDAGALKKIYDLAKQLMYGIDTELPIVIANKHRDVASGKILSTSVPDIDQHIRLKKKFVIVDDICDGGRTFIEIAKVIKNRAKLIADSSMVRFEYNPEIYLVVSHGIFSNGFKELEQYFDGIFSSNSVRQIETYGPSKVKQFNLF